MFIKYQILAVVVGVYVTLSSVLSTEPGLNQSEWFAYKTQYTKTYESDAIESTRRTIFAQNKQFVEDFNNRLSKRVGFELGLNHFSDMSESEFNSIYNGYKSEGEIINSPEANNFLAKIFNDDTIDVPDELDWRTFPARVSAVKYQGHCKSCWAFAAVGALEGQEKKLYGSIESIIELSEQYLVDCMNASCKDGGSVSKAFDFVRNGIVDSASYPYRGTSGACKFNKDKVVISDKGYAWLPIGDEDTLKVVVARFGPVSVFINSHDIKFKHYRAGVYDNPACSKQSDHAVLIVGYGTDPINGEYWIVKNSWGLNWGDQGYVLMKRNKENQCGIVSQAIIPIF